MFSRDISNPDCIFQSKCTSAVGNFFHSLTTKTLHHQIPRQADTSSLRKKKKFNKINPELELQKVKQADYFVPITTSTVHQKEMCKPCRTT